MIRVVIVEDEPDSRAHIRRLASQFAGVEVVAECGDGAEAVREIVARKPDLVFLDVQLPEMDGFEVLEALPADLVPSIIFVTAHDDFAVRAFETHAVDYLLKPFGRARFAKAFGHALERLQSRGRAGAHPAQGAPDARGSADEDGAEREPLARFVVRGTQKAYFVPVQDVDWIDVADNYLQLHCARRVHLVRATLSEVSGRLPARTFVRIHRGILVRIDRIASIQSYSPGVYSVTLTDGTRLHSSRGYAAEVRGLLR